MPAALSYPGVYLEEISSGVRTITGVATSITAFLGRAARGPTDDPVMINSYGDFERQFGGLGVDYPMSYAVRDFYLNGGASAIIARLYGAPYSSSQDTAKAIQAAQDTATATTGADATAAATAAGAKAALYPNEPEKSAAAAVAKAAHDASLVGGATLLNVQDAANKAASLIAASSISKATIRYGNMSLEAASEGIWGNDLRVRVDHDVDASAGDVFNLTVRDGQTGRTERFRNLSISPLNVRRIDKVLANESDLLNYSGALPATTPAAHAALPAGKTDIWGDYNPATNSKVADVDKSNDGVELSQLNFDGPGKASNKKGLYALEQADLFNLLCIPPYKADGDVDDGLLDSAAAYCEARRAMLLIDAPNSWASKDSAKSGVSGVSGKSQNAALFFPRLTQPNPLKNNQLENFAPCGAVAGVFARTDTTRGVWKAPAGIEATVVGAPGLGVNLTDLENGELNPLGVNCLRSSPVSGRIIWGSRTRKGDDRLASEWKYIPVRRTALFIEESLYRGTQWIVFEPNDEPLWAQVRLNIGAFMNTLFRQGAFQGKTPAEAYFVKCDKETTTQNDINLGIVNIVVGFAPLKPAEFVVIKLQQIAGQVQA
jgi:phage tail sheath protein FI